MIGKKYINNRSYARRSSLGFQDDLRALALARMENDRALRSGLTGRRAAAMSIPFKSELATAKPCPEENPGGRGDNQERDGLLPVHARNIVQGGRFATKIITMSVDSSSLR